MNRVDLDRSVGYALKRAQSALRAAMDRELREHDLSVPQYACLELLCQRPGISNAELARGVFVTRQATHQLLAGLRRAGLVNSTGNGRNERISPTADGQSRLLAASKAVRAIEERMLAPLSDAERERLQGDLTACAKSLAASAEVDKLDNRATLADGGGAALERAGPKVTGRIDSRHAGFE